MAKKHRFSTCLGLILRGCGPPSLPVRVHGATYLAQTNGVVEGLSSCVEVHCLPHLLLALVLPGQVIGRGPVSGLVGYISSLEKHQRDLRGSGSLSPSRSRSRRPDGWKVPTF